jgi:hypothetical protein
MAKQTSKPAAKPAAKTARRQQGWSVMTVTICAAAVVALLAWAAAASAYATDRWRAEAEAAEAAGEDGPVDPLAPPPRIRLRRTAAAAFGIRLFVEFFKNAIVEIPRAPQVIIHALTQRPLIPIGFVIVEVLVIGGGFGLKSMEHSMEQSKPGKRKSTVESIRVPKPLDD